MNIIFLVYILSFVFLSLELYMYCLIYKGFVKYVLNALVFDFLRKVHPWHSSPGMSLHCQVENHVRRKKIYIF